MATTFKKRKYISNETPAGIAKYPKLNTPDTKYKPLGEYSTKLVLTAEEAQPLIDQYEQELQRFFDEEKERLLSSGDPKDKAKAKGLKMAADKPFKPELDDEAEETGNVVFNFKMPARVAREGKPDLVLTPDVFDAKGKKLVKVPEIWGGSKLIVAYQLRPFNTAIGVGLSLRLQGFQILDLKQGGERSYGFKAHEGGYEAGSEGADDSSDDSGNDGPQDSDSGDF